MQTCAQRSGVESISGAGIANHRHVILQLNLVRIRQLENRRVLDFDLYDRDVLTLIVTLAGWRAVLFDLEWIRTAVGNDHVVKDLKALKLAVLIDVLRVQLVW